jgi:hypothetical protein
VGFVAASETRVKTYEIELENVKENRPFKRSVL